MKDSIDFMYSVKRLRNLTKEKLEERKCCHWMTGTKNDPYRRDNHTSTCEVITFYRNLNEIENFHLDQRSNYKEIAKTILMANVFSFLCVSPITTLLIILIHGTIGHIIIFSIAAILYALLFVLHLNKVFDSVFCSRISELKEEIEVLEEQKRNLLEANDSLSETALTKS